MTRRPPSKPFVPRSQVAFAAGAVEIATRELAPLIRARRHLDPFLTLQENRDVFHRLQRKSNRERSANPRL